MYLCSNNQLIVIMRSIFILCILLCAASAGQFKFTSRETTAPAQSVENTTDTASMRRVTTTTVQSASTAWETTTPTQPDDTTVQICTFPTTATTDRSTSTTQEVKTPTQPNENTPSLTSTTSWTTRRVHNFCPFGWFNFGTRCFKFVNVPLSWYRAEKYCNIHRAHLTAVTGPKEYSYLQRVIQRATQRYAWLGGFNLQGRWMWISRDTYFYKNWHRHFPRGTNSCITMTTSTGWMNIQCASKFPFICSRNLSGC